MNHDSSASIVSKVWNYAHVLKNAGVGYGDYVEQITYLLFLKLADEMADLGYDNPIPPEFGWSVLSSKSGDDLEIHYRHTLENLGKVPGLVGIIFRKAQNKISNPSDLQRVIKMIGDEDWSGMDVDIKGAIYEGLLEKTASSSDKGAGQYFTPRPLIRAIVEVMQPKPGQVIGDPACGTGGFLLAAHDYISQHYKLDKAQRKHLKTEALWGTDIVDSVVRLCAMNMYLHGIGSRSGVPPLASPPEDKRRDAASTIDRADALAQPSGRKFDMILANPPFGKKGGYTIVGEDGKISTEKQEYERDEFWATTANKQLNFLQHIVSELKIGGSAAVVLPDNVLFEGGAGETIRRELLKRCNVHTLLRLPTGIFYAQGVKANVLFFERKPASETPWTKDLWIYDLRTNQHFTLKTNPLKESDLEDFVKCYQSRSGVPPLASTPEDKRQDAASTRFKRFTYEEIIARDKANLDILWLKDDSLEDSENLPPPAVLAAEIVESLEVALEEFRAVEEALGK